jgi:hypothetical protein
MELEKTTGNPGIVYKVPPTHGKAVCLTDGGLHEDIGRTQGHRVGPAASYQ